MYVVPPLKCISRSATGEGATSNVFFIKETIENTTFMIDYTKILKS